jgi:hypothetical protein
MNQDQKKIEDVMCHTPIAGTPKTRRGFMEMAAAVGAGALGIGFFGRRQQAAAEEVASGKLHSEVADLFDADTQAHAETTLVELVEGGMPIGFIRVVDDVEMLEWHIAGQYVVETGPLDPTGLGITPSAGITVAAAKAVACGYTYSGWYCMNARWGIGVCYNRYRHVYYCGQYRGIQYGFSEWCPWRCY